MWTETPPPRFPKVQIWRRGCALLVDTLPLWLISSLLGGNPLIDLLVWLGLRVLVVLKTQGQSLGRWAFDMKVVDERSGRTPEPIALAKREALAGLGLILALIGIAKIDPMHAQYLMLLLPLAADCSIAYFEPVRQQAFHDRLAGTVVVSTRRGYSLDLKVKRWVAQLRRFVKQ